MRVRDLGALIVDVDGVQRPVGGPKAAALLALMVINANRRVSIDTVMDALWGDRVTAGTASTLESHVWRLRQVLEPGRATRQPPSVLVNEAGGYRLNAHGHTVDSLLFEQIAGEVHDQLTTGQALRAVTRAEDALALWRGDPYGALGDHDWAQPAVARLTELRDQIAERRIDGLIAAGHLDQALADLEPLLAAAPFREHLRAQQMLALYRSGRIEKALNAFQRMRAALIEDVGTEPGPELLTLHRMILDHDHGLNAAPITTRAPRPVEVQLPPVMDALIGRAAELDALTALLRRDAMITIVGAAGCGKTRLVIEVASRAASDFPDGVWFVDLAAVTDPDLVVDAIVSTIGFSASPSATPLEDLTAYLRDRQLLVVLDNCEHVLDAVARIAEATLGHARETTMCRCRILATSREPIDVAGETTWPLPPLALTQDDPRPHDGPNPVDAAPSPAVELFLQRLHAVAPALPLDAEVLTHAAVICAAVDGLPLAIELAAARARSYRLTDIATQVSIDPGQLRRSGRRGRAPDHRDTIRSSIQWSHHLLSTEERLLHRRLAVLPGTFTHAAAAAVTPDLGADEVGDLLAHLVHRSMLTSNASHPEAGLPTTFSQLATVRAHARETLCEEGELASAINRRNDWIIDLVENRPRLGSPAEVDWFHTLDQNYATMRATLADVLIERPDLRGPHLAPPLTFYWYFRTNVLEATRWLQLAHDLTHDRDTTQRITTGAALGAALAVQGRLDAARPHIATALRDTAGVPTDRLVDVGEALVVLAASLWVHEVHDLVIDVNTALTSVAERSNDPQLSVLAESCACMAMIATGHLDQAASRAETIYQRAQALNNDTAGWIAAAAPLTAALLHQQPIHGIPWLGRVMQAHLRLGGTTAGMFIEVRANYETQRGRHHQAAQLYAAARTHTRRAAMIWPRRTLTHHMLTETRNQLRPADYENAVRKGEQLTLADIAALS